MTYRATVCNSCHAPIFWASTTAKGKPMPLDLEPHDNGNVEVIEGQHGPLATVLGPLEVQLARGVGSDLFMPHHATCPDAADWKGPR